MSKKMMRDPCRFGVEILTLGAAYFSPAMAEADTIRARDALQYLGLTVGELATVSTIGTSDYAATVVIHPEFASELTEALTEYWRGALSAVSNGRAPNRSPR
jgi:hypothetical protein